MNPDAGGFTCPRCRRTSHHPDDVREGYCGACHDWTRQLVVYLTPGCPLCGHAPVIVLPGGEQAFCGTANCDVISWDPSASLDDNLLNVAPIVPRDTGGQGAGR
jgi:hypothetical protein